jgi:hypothetical protein
VYHGLVQPNYLAQNNKIKIEYKILIDDDGICLPLSNVNSLPYTCKAFCSSSSPVITVTSSYLRLEACASSISRAASESVLLAATPLDEADSVSVFSCRNVQI